MTPELSTPAPVPLCPAHRAPAKDVCGRCGSFCCEACGRATAEGWRCVDCAERERAPRPGNPWLTVWTRPRATMRWLRENAPPTRTLHLLAALGGISSALDLIPERYLGGDQTLGAVLLAVAAGPLYGLAWLYVDTFVTWALGRLVGGRGSGADVRCAFAWGSGQQLWYLALLQLPCLAALRTLPVTETETSAMSAVAEGASIAFTLGAFILLSWILVNAVKMVAEAHRFSSWRALVPVAALVGIGFAENALLGLAGVL